MGLIERPHRRTRALLLLLFVTAAGLGLKAYVGPGRWLLNNWGASFAYELFFMLLAFIALPKRKAIPRIAIAVCLATVALEFLQLWHPDWLERLRAGFIGRSLLGNRFSWSDLPAYPLGCLLGCRLLRRIST